MKKNRRTKIRKPRKPLFYTADPRTSELKFLDELKDPKPAPARPQARKPVTIHSVIAAYEKTKEGPAAASAAVQPQAQLQPGQSRAMPRAAQSGTTHAALAETVFGHSSSRAVVDSRGDGAAELAVTDSGASLSCAVAASEHVAGSGSLVPGDGTNVKAQGAAERCGSSEGGTAGSGAAAPEGRGTEQCDKQLDRAVQDASIFTPPGSVQTLAAETHVPGGFGGCCSGIVRFSIPDGMERIHVPIVLPSFFCGNVRGRTGSYAVTAVSNQPGCQVFVSSKTEKVATLAVQRSKATGIVTGELNWIAARIAPIS